MPTFAALRLVLALALAAASAGCALDAPPTAADLRADVLPQAALPATFALGRGDAAPVRDSWLASFNDPALVSLVNEALLHNADLQVAAARVEQATGYVRVAHGALLPSLGLAGVGGGKSGGSGGLDGVFLNASLELDVWGRLRYGQAAAQAQADAVAADYAYARQSIAATVAKAWFLAIEAGLQRSIAQDALVSAQTMLRLAQERLRIGNGNAQAEAQARANVGSYQDVVQQVTLAREQAVRALELLLGRYPSAELAIATQLAAMPAPVPVGMPSELLERRPDMIAAERRVAAAFNRVGEAKAARLPRISLTAGGSTVSSDLIVLKNAGDPIWSVGANLVAPIYKGGALQAQVEISTAEQKQAVAEYARAGQKAFGEVEGALSAEAILRERGNILATTVRASEDALSLAQTQYRVGSADLRAVEQSQLSLYSLKTARLRVQTEQLAQRVNLYLALGGDFDQAPPAAGP